MITNNYENSADPENFIDESLIVDMSYYEKIKEEITCLICYGLLNNPIMCENCETHFCQICIEGWKKANKGCPKQCPKPIVLKKMVRSFKNLLDKVLLKCKACKESITLISYPEHIKPCTEKNSFITCPFCKSCRINKDGLELSKNIDKNQVESISIKKVKLENTFKEYKATNEKVNQNLQEKVIHLEQEIGNTRNDYSEKFRQLKTQNDQYIKDAYDKKMENFNLMKELEQLMINRSLEKKKSVNKKTSFVEKNILKEFISICQTEVITAVSSILYKDEVVIAAGGRDKQIRIFSLSNLDTPLLKLKGHTNHINVIISFLYKDEWLLASAGSDKTIRVWKLTSPESNFIVIRAHTDNINALISINYKDTVYLVSASTDWAIKLWNVTNSDNPVMILKGHYDAIYALESISIDNETILVSGSKDHSIKVWNLKVPDIPALALIDHSDTIFALKAMLHKGNQYIASGSRDQTIKIWLINSLQANKVPVMTLRGHFDYVRVLTTIVFQNELLLVSGSWDKNIKIWSLDTPENALQTLRGHTDYVVALTSFVYKNETVLLSAGQDLTMKLFK